jgi:hypothetical protein
MNKTICIIHIIIMMMIHVEPYDLYYLKNTLGAGERVYDTVDEFCDNCTIQDTRIYKINRNKLMLQISYTLDGVQYHMNIGEDLMHKISYLFRRQWEHDMHVVHRELFRKHAKDPIQNLHEELMAVYWHIDNFKLWEGNLSHEWGSFNN